MQYLNSYLGNAFVMLGNGSTILISKSRSSIILGQNHKLCFNNVLLVPQLENNLTSLKKLYEDNNVSTDFFLNSFFVNDMATKITLQDWTRNNHIRYYPMQ